jgi:hypothetical protein
MRSHVSRWIWFNSCVLICAALAVPSANAEFPPEGATQDARNPAIATGDYSGSHYVYYFDCGKREWIGVAVSGALRGDIAPLLTENKGRLFPPGPPTGAKRDAKDSNRATNIATGTTYRFRDGLWLDTKTGQKATSPKLCSDSATPEPRKPPAERPPSDDAIPVLPPTPVIGAAPKPGSRP